MSTGVAAARNLMHRSREEHFAVGAFNVDNQETLVAITRAAQTTGALVESEPHYFGGSSNVHTEDIDYDEIRKTFSTPEGAYGTTLETQLAAHPTSTRS